MLRKCVIFRTMLPIRCAHIIGPPYVFAMDVPLEFTQDESGSASFGIIPIRQHFNLHWTTILSVTT